MLNRLGGSTNRECVEDCLAELTDIIVTAGKGHCTSTNGKGVGFEGHRKRVNQGWYDDECVAQGKLFKEGQIRYYDTGTEECRIWMCTQRSIYRKLCRLKKREYDRQQSEELAELSQSNPSKFWDKVKHKKQTHKLPPGDLFYEHFKGLAKRVSRVSDCVTDEINDRNRAIEHCNECLDSEIRMGELERAIRKLKGGKAAGLDAILNEFIVNSTHEMKSLILSIFNSILSLEYFPSCWALGSIVPVYKSGDREDVNNYRGITILSCLGKLFTRILNDRQLGRN